MNILITGSAKRIGAAMATYFAQRGHRIIIHYHTSEKEALALRETLPNPLSHALLRMDLLKENAAADLMEAARPYQPDVLINNASVYTRMPLSDASPERVMEAYRINFMVPFDLMRCFRTAFRKGQIINILDHRVDCPDPASGPYAFAKKSLKDATLACALEWAPEMKVNAVAPAFVLPPDGVPLERMNRLVKSSPLQARPLPEHLAQAIEFLLNAPSITGQVLYLDGGLHLMSPSAAAKEK